MKSCIPRKNKVSSHLAYCIVEYSLHTSREDRTKDLQRRPNDSDQYVPNRPVGRASVDRVAGTFHKFNFILDSVLVVPCTHNVALVNFSPQIDEQYPRMLF